MLELGPLLKAAILGIVEGLTEFLPISSTGHLILAGDLLDFEGEKESAFLIMIQTGAMLAVMWQYRVKFTDLAVERYYRSWRVESVDDMTFRDALMVGIAQCFALIPGVSRAGATIIGGMLCGLSRKAATEFSFFLAVPTLIAAGGYDLMKHRGEFSVDDIELLAVGLIVSFISALICIRWLLRYVANHTFNVFAWYRIILGAIILIVLW